MLALMILGGAKVSMVSTSKEGLQHGRRKERGAQGQGDPGRHEA